MGRATKKWRAHDNSSEVLHRAADAMPSEFADVGAFRSNADMRANGMQTRVSQKRIRVKVKEAAQEAEEKKMTHLEFVQAVQAAKEESLQQVNWTGHGPGEPRVRFKKNSFAAVAVHGLRLQPVEVQKLAEDFKELDADESGTLEYDESVKSAPHANH
jgi:hypothetical protein